MKLVSAALGAVFVVFLTILPAAAQTGGTTGTFIQNSDPSIVYSPEVCTIQNGQNCFGAWWDTGLEDGTLVKTTAGPSSSYNNVQTTLTVSFRGTSLEVHGLRDPYGANVILQLDSTAGAVNTSTGMGGAVQQPSLLAYYDDLDAQTVHTLSLGWLGNVVNDDGDTNSYAYFDHLVIADFQAVGNPTTTTASMQASPTTSLPPDSEGPSEPKLAPGAIAGIVVVLLLLVLLVFGSCYFLQHQWRFLFRKRKRLQRVNLTVDSHDDIQGRQTCRPASPAMSILKAHPHTSLPPAYFAKWQAKGGSGYGAGDGYGGISYLDLESGTTHDGESESQSDTPGRDLSSSTPKQSERKDMQLGDPEREGKSGRARFPAPLLPLLIPRKAPPRESTLIYPPRAHQGTSLASGSKSPSQVGELHVQDPQEEAQKSPRTPYTSYRVTTATRTVARLQSAQVVQPAAARSSGRESRHKSRANASGSSPGKSGVSKVGPAVRLPPLPPLPNPFEEKGRLSRVVKGARVRKSRAPTAVHEGTTTASPPRNLGFLAADPTVASSSLSFWSLDTRKSSANISLGSLPPPYALNP